jgi:hypothetical protein
MIPWGVNLGQCPHIRTMPYLIWDLENYQIRWQSLPANSATTDLAGANTFAGDAISSQMRSPEK